MEELVKEFKIVQKDGEFCAVSEDGETSFGCFPTEEEARERLRQVEAAKAAKNKETTDDKSHSDSFDLDNVEIFRAGVWNGDRYTTKDLDDIVSAFEHTGFKPPLKLGHRENSGDPAYGWVANIRRSGDRIVASFTDLPEPIFEAIKQKRFNSVSSEIFFNLKRNGVVFRRALKAVALLGAEIPAVSGLKPLHDSFKGLSAESESVYTLRLEDFMNKDDKVNDDVKSSDEDTAAKLTEAEEKIKQLTAKLNKADDSALEIKRLNETVVELTDKMAKTEEARRQESIRSKVDKLRIPALREHIHAIYDLATNSEETVKFTVNDGDDPSDVNPIAVVDDLVERLNTHTEKLFRELSVNGDLERDDTPRNDGDRVDLEVDRLTKAYMAKNKIKDYSEAMNAVLDDPENRALKSKYAGV